ncbi:MAG: S24/S26 family peptidase [Bacteroidales bacterium]|nr:S24/S26 family peptidase [Bacteroidales bacterium]
MGTIIKDTAIIMEEVRKLISEGLTVELTAKGYSMNPFIMHMRDQVVLGPFSDTDIRKGVTVLVKDIKGNYILHRIIRRDGDRITLMGDGNINLTETANVDEIIGVLYSIKRKGRTYSTEGFIWRLYSSIWSALTPLRRWPLGLWRRLNPQKPLR